MFDGKGSWFCGFSSWSSRLLRFVGNCIRWVKCHRCFPIRVSEHWIHATRQTLVSYDDWCRKHVHESANWEIQNIWTAGKVKRKAKLKMILKNAKGYRDERGVFVRTLFTRNISFDSKVSFLLKTPNKLNERHYDSRTKIHYTQRQQNFYHQVEPEQSEE